MTGPLLSFGEALIDFFAAADAGADSSAPPPTLAVATRFERHLGGAPCNVAVGLARLGVPTAFIGQVGADAFGHFIRDALAAEGVDVTALTSSPRRTPVVFVGLDAAGEPTFLFFRERSADAALEPRTIDAHADLVRRACALHLGTNTSSVEPCASATRRLVDLCLDAGVPISLDVNLRLHLWDDAGRAVAAARELCGVASLVKANAAEAEQLTGERDPHAAARALFALGPALVVITRGAAGATYLHAAGAGDVGAPRVACVDSTGAGDAFCAALLAGMREHAGLAALARPRGQTLDDARVAQIVRRACVVAASVCTAVGATAGLPRELLRH